MSWDEYVKSCKQAVTQRQQTDDPCSLPVQLLQTFRLPGADFDSVSHCYLKRVSTLSE